MVRRRLGMGRGRTAGGWSRRTDCCEVVSFTPCIAGLPPNAQHLPGWFRSGTAVSRGGVITPWFLAPEEVAPSGCLAFLVGVITVADLGRSAPSGDATMSSRTIGPT